MKAIILAAGRGSRMGALTDDRPKCMTPIGDVPLLHRAAGTLRACGVEDVVVVRGYRAADVVAPGVRYRDNPAWSATNMLGSLFANADEVSGDLLVSYADIVFERRVVETALGHPGDICPVVDLDWRGSYVGRTQHPPSEAEKVVLGPGAQVRRIGKANVSADEADGEFIGMIKMTACGTARLAHAFAAARQSFQGRAFQTAGLFETAYLTDLLQELIDRGSLVEAACVAGGWREIDTPEDLRNASRWMARAR